MTAAEEAAKLRAQADALELVGTLTEVMDAAKQRFIDNPTDESKAAYRAAVDELSAAREQHRAVRTAVLVEPGSVTITPGGFGVSGRAS